MKNCSNCKHRNKYLTEDPCVVCRFIEYWEPDEESDLTEEDDENTNQDTV